MNLSDPSGAVIPLLVLAALKLAALGALEGAVIGGIYALINCLNFWEQVLIGGLSGAILGPLVGGLVGAGGWLIRKWGGGLIKGGIKRWGTSRLGRWFNRGGRRRKGPLEPDPIDVFEGEGGALSSGSQVSHSPPPKPTGVPGIKPEPGVLQTGGHTIRNRTRKALGLSKSEAKLAMERLKKDIGQGASHHQHKILDNGDVLDSNSGDFLQSN